MANPTVNNSASVPQGFAAWLEGARPRTWPNAFAPVLAGSAASYAAGSFRPLIAVLCLIVSWALIIGVNFANDYSDGIKGTDEDRTGPLRLVASGVKSAAQVKRAAFLSFGVAGIAGLIISLTTYPWLILVGLVCILAAWFYTGGKNPYGYRGLGEVSVFIFFGLVAVCGTQLVQARTITLVGVLLACAIGAFSAAVNLANNLRDIPSDTESGKITLAVKLGDARTRKFWLGLVFVPYLLAIVLAIAESPVWLLPLISFPSTIIAAKPIRENAKGKALIPVLGLTGKAMLMFTFMVIIAAVWPR